MPKSQAWTAQRRPAAPVDGAGVRRNAAPTLDEAPANNGLLPSGFSMADCPSRSRVGEGTLRKVPLGETALAKLLSSSSCDDSLRSPD